MCIGHFTEKLHQAQEIGRLPTTYAETMGVVPGFQMSGRRWSIILVELKLSLDVVMVRNHPNALEKENHLPLARYHQPGYFLLS